MVWDIEDDGCDTSYMTMGQVTQLVADWNAAGQPTDILTWMASVSPWKLYSWDMLTRAIEEASRVPVDTRVQT